MDVATHSLDDDDWESAIAAAPLTAERVGRGRVAGPSWVRPAGSSLSYISGSNLLAVGDAMVSFDPVTGDGLSFAVVSGIEAAAMVADEHRWPDAPFWSTQRAS
ncbi:MAG TPA: hypothetical protein VFV63_11555 [Ilumatobacteraceae bacterium]|nr:hypothetical protein [Ilumatobacteraceae bacterium]